MVLKIAKNSGLIIEIETEIKKDGAGGVKLAGRYTYNEKSGNFRDICVIDGRTCIRFYAPLNFKGKTCDAIEVDSVIIDGKKVSDILIDLQNEAKRNQDEGRKNFINDLKSGKINLTKKLVGCDFPEFVFSVDEEAVEKKYNIFGAWDILHNYLAYYKINGKTYDFYKIPMGYEDEKDGNIILKELILKIENKNLFEIEKEEKRNATKLLEAIEKKEKVVLWIENIECNGEVQDCSFDDIGEYIYPDGHRENFHIHCH